MCPVPPSILNGTMKYGSLEVGQKVTYTCSPGFVMEGRNTLTCARSGAWNRGEPKCLCKRTNREHWKFCRRQCNPSTSGSCRNNQECICDGDCGYSCVPKGLKKTYLYILLLAFMKRFMALLQLLWEYKALSCPWKMTLAGASSFHNWNTWFCSRFLVSDFHLSTYPFLISWPRMVREFCVGDWQT